MPLLGSTHRIAVLATTLGLAVCGLVATSATAANGPATCTRVAGDFNGDGRADVATGEPYRTVNSLANAGAVRVLYGTGHGLSPSGNRYLDETALPRISAAASDHFGMSVAAGFLNGDCYADLAVGVPGAGGGVGAVAILFGSANGLTAARATVVTAGDVDTAATITKQKFGWTLAIGDFDADGHTDLAVGANGRDGFAGGVDILYGASGGPNATNAQMITSSTPGIAGTADKGDQFGYALAAGDFDGDGADDLAIGVPGKKVGSAGAAGTVISVPGSRTGLNPTSSRSWRQGVGGLGGTAETNDRFGFALAAGDITGDGRDDLAIGTPDESIGTADEAGSVQVVLGSATGLTGGSSETWTQHNPLIPGAAEVGDRFGWSVSLGDIDGDGHDDLVIGAPYEDIDTIVDAGSVTVLYGRGTGITTTGAQAWSQSSPGIAGGAEPKDDFGYSVGSGRISSKKHDDLVIGVPGEDIGSYVNNGALAVLSGSTTGLTALGNRLIDSSQLVGGAQSFAKMGSRVG